EKGWRSRVPITNRTWQFPGSPHSIQHLGKLRCPELPESVPNREVIGVWELVAVPDCGVGAEPTLRALHAAARRRRFDHSGLAEEGKSQIGEGRIACLISTKSRITARWRAWRQGWMDCLCEDRNPICWDRRWHNAEAI